MYQACLKLLEFHVIQMNGISLTALPEALNCTSAQWKQVSIPPLGSLSASNGGLKLLFRALKSNEYGWEAIRDFNMVAFLMGLQKVLSSFHAISVFGIVETEEQNERKKIGLKGLSSHWEGTMSNMSYWWTLKRFYFPHCTSY